MKKSFMTRVLAMGLSFAMAFSLSAATNVTTASAAAKKVGVTTMMKVSTKSVTEGKTVKTYMNSTALKKYRIKKVAKLSAVADKYIDVDVITSGSKNRQGLEITAHDGAVTAAKLEKKGVYVTIYFAETTSPTKAAKATAKKYAKLKVAVNAVPVKKATITDVAQNASTKITMTLAAAIEKIDIADVKIVRDDTQAVIAVKSATIDATDKTKVVVETYTDMADGKEFTVTYTAQDEAKTVSSKKFTATDGKINSFKLSTDKVTVNKATTIKYTAVDANGVEIYTKEINDKPNGIDVEYTCDNGYVDGAKLTLMAVGSTAKVTVTYHTYKYDAAGTETGVVKGEFTITAVENSATVSKFNYTIVNAGDVPAWENVTVNTKLAMNDSGKVARFQIKDSNGEDITKTCGYTVESSDGKILLASGDVKDGASLTPVAEGSAYLVLKDDTKTVTTLPITVVAKRIITNFELKKTAVAIATTAAVNSAAETSIGYTLKDQYGDKMTGVNVSEPVCKNWPSGASATTLTVSTDDTNGMIKIAAPTNSTKGTYTYTVVATDKENKTQTRSFTVNVVQPSGDSTYSLQFVKNTGADSVKGKDAIDTLDSTVTKDTANASHISVNVVEKKSGVVIGNLAFSDTVSVAAIKVVGSDGKTYAASGAGVSKVVTSDAIIETEVASAAGLNSGTGTVFDILAVAQSTNTYTKKLPAGTYNVVVTLAKVKDGKKITQDVAGSFKVEDKQPALTANVLSTTVKNATSIKAVLNNNKDYVKYVYDGVTQIDENDASMIASINTVYGKANKNSCVVNKVTVEVKIPASSNTVMITIPINRVFTTDQTQWDASEFTAP